MNLEQPCIRISVRNLVEFILRHGDIDNRTGGADKEAMQQGGRIHRKIQSFQRAEQQRLSKSMRNCIHIISARNHKLL